MSVVGQIHINRLPIQEDIKQEIKSWCFYDRLSGNTRLQKKEVLKNIQHAYTMETEGYRFFWLSEQECRERFWFVIGDIENYPLENWVMHQCDFCQICGNYKEVSTDQQYDVISINAWCYCGMPPLIEVNHE